MAAAMDRQKEKRQQNSLNRNAIVGARSLMSHTLGGAVPQRIEQWIL